MSLPRFLFYSAFTGGWAAFVGWLLGEALLVRGAAAVGTGTYLLLSAIGFGGLLIGSREIQPSGLARLLQGIMLFAIIGSEVFNRYRIRFTWICFQHDGHHETLVKRGQGLRRNPIGQHGGLHRCSTCGTP